MIERLQDAEGKPFLEKFKKALSVLFSISEDIVDLSIQQEEEFFHSIREDAPGQHTEQEAT